MSSKSNYRLKSRVKRVLPPLLCYLSILACVLMMGIKLKGPVGIPLHHGAAPPEKLDGVQAFFDGFPLGYYRATPFKDACRHPRAAAQIYCEEGFHLGLYQRRLEDHFKAWRDRSPSIEAPELVSRPIQSIALGSLLGSRSIPLDRALFRLEGREKYFADGFGYGRASSLGQFVGRPEELCRGVKAKSYCLFGVGRALFFHARPRWSSTPLPEPIAEGFRFAGVLSGAHHGQITSHAQKVAYALSQGGEQMTGSSPLGRCLGSARGHVLDCKP